MWVPFARRLPLGIPPHEFGPFHPEFMRAIMKVFHGLM
jgi:hypothetical protein